MRDVSGRCQKVICSFANAQARFAALAHNRLSDFNIAHMRRIGFLAAGWLSLGLGGIGALLPILPTVPFVLLATWCFARSSPRLEAWLVGHPLFGYHIRNWRQSGAISRTGKRAALGAFVITGVVGLAFSPFPWSLLPLAAALIGGTWIWRRPEPEKRDR